MQMSVFLLLMFAKMMNVPVNYHFPIILIPWPLRENWKVHNFKV